MRVRLTAFAILDTGAVLDNLRSSSDLFPRRLPKIMQREDTYVECAVISDTTWFNLIRENILYIVSGRYVLLVDGKQRLYGILPVELILELVGGAQSSLDERKLCM